MEVIHKLTLVVNSALAKPNMVANAVDGGEWGRNLG